MKLGLGTVQLGGDYGVSNRDGRPGAAVARALLDCAFESGIRVFDTAADYGESEELVGRGLDERQGVRIVTKTPAFEASSIAAADASALRAVFERSRARLRQPQLYGLLLHAASDLLKPGGLALWEAMQTLRGEGLVERIGVSVYSGAELDAVLARVRPDLVQLPLNPLDQRLREDGQLARLKALGVEVHARSVFLQGLLLMEPDELPAYFRRFDAQLSRYQSFRRERALGPLQAALLFIRGIEEVDVALLGANSPEQLRQCVEMFESSRGSGADFSALACREEALINPARWPAREYTEERA